MIKAPGRPQHSGPRRRRAQTPTPLRPSYPPAYHVTDLLDAQRLDRHDLRAGGDPSLLGPGHLDLAGQQRFAISEAAGRLPLTRADLRLLPYLQTHLTAAAIAERLFISSHTVKAEVKSIYRKLGVASRHDAVQKTALALLGAQPAAGSTGLRVAGVVGNWARGPGAPRQRQ